MNEMIVSMQGIQKYFHGVHALNNVQFELKKGEVLGLVGENGAGKSTLMKVLTGIYAKDGGQIIYGGKEINLKSPAEGLEAGLVMVHQELNLIPHLTIAENIFIGREFTKGLSLDAKRCNQKTVELLEMLEVDLNPAQKVGTLTVANQQIVEIAKAISFDSRVLILDEPTAALTDTEIEEVFRILRQLKEKGVSIVYISHRLEELKEITDRITVMRDGAYVDTIDTAESTVEQIISMMVGRVIYEEHKTESNVKDNADVVLEVKHVSSPVVKDASFTLRSGEILGISGLMGAGRTELARLIFGADRLLAGEIYVKGKAVSIKSPKDAVANGIGYISEDRKSLGIATGLSVIDNLALPNWDKYTRFGAVDSAALEKDAGEYVKKINIKTPSFKQKVMDLSGGNQQKVVVAKWLMKNCDILIFDEPTRGIDVGAKNEIYKLMNQLVDEGKSIIMISSEMPEILRMSDRIIVMCEGKLTGMLNIEETTQEKIMGYATLRQ